MRRKSFFNTAPRLQSDDVIKLIAMGKAKDLHEAVENERQSGTGTGTHNGITVRRICRLKINLS